MDSPEKPANLRTFLFALALAIISGSSQRIERICRHHRGSGDATRTAINLMLEMVFSRVHDVNWFCILGYSFLLRNQSKCLNIGTFDLVLSRGRRWRRNIVS